MQENDHSELRKEYNHMHLYNNINWEKEIKERHTYNSSSKAQKLLAPSPKKYKLVMKTANVHWKHTLGVIIKMNYY